MKESYTTTITIDPQGTVWAKHGDVDRMSVLDGYSTRQIADPRSLGRVYRSAAGQIWTFDTQRLKQYSGGQWISYAVPELAAVKSIQPFQDHRWFLYPTRDVSASRMPARVSILPQGPNRVLILLPGTRVIEYDAAAQHARTIATANAATIGPFLDWKAKDPERAWIAAEHGLGKLQKSSSGRDDAYQFTEFPLDMRGFHTLEEPSEGNENEVFASATASGSGNAAVVRFDGEHWQSVYQGHQETVRGWRGSDNAIWIQDGGNLMRLGGNRIVRVEPTAALSGTIFDAASQPGGVFWISTSQGLGRYAPALWRTPASVDIGPKSVNSIIEDTRHRIWFARPTSLVSFDGEHWRTFPLPTGDIQNYTNTDALCPLKDGRIVIKVAEDSYLLVFDPERQSFARYSHPGGKLIRTIVPRKDGTVWVVTQTPGSMQSFLETFDGRNFRNPFSTASIFDITDLRTVCETSNGDLWVGGTRSLGVLSRGRFRFVGARDGYTANGAFVIHEKTDGSILAGGRDKLFEFDGKSWQVVRSHLDRIRSIVIASDGTAWIASGTGIHRYHNHEWITNSVEEGLPSSIVYKVFQDSTGRIWAGTSLGLSLFHPDADTDPPTTFISAEQNLRETAPDGKVRLVFSGIDKWKYTLTERLLFSWRLDGSRWSLFSSDNFASYKDLGGGKHTFEVRAMDRNGNIDPSPASFHFSVLPPWYQDSGFLLIAACAVVVIAFLILLAVSHYLNRGKLIRQLNQSNLVDQDRKRILQMIANRKPLDEVLNGITQSVEKHCPGTMCSVLLRKDGRLHLAAGSKLPDRCRKQIESGVDSGEDATNQEVADWYSLPIVSASANLAGLLVIWHSAHSVAVPSDIVLLDSMCKLAGAALENNELYAQLEYQSSHDSLTQLPNRTAFEKRLQQALDSATRYGRRAALLFVDLGPLQSNQRFLWSQALAMDCCSRSAGDWRPAYANSTHWPELAETSSRSWYMR